MITSFIKIFIKFCQCVAVIHFFMIGCKLKVSCQLYKIQEILPKDYNRQLNPPVVFPENKTIIYVQCSIEHIAELDTKKKSYSLRWNLRLFWNDPRFIKNGRKYSLIGLAPADHIIWTPIIIIGNERHSKIMDVIDTNQYFVVSPYNDVLDTMRVLYVSFKLQREFYIYLLDNYFPLSLLVIVSWVSFWLRIEEIEARVQLGITTILTTITSVVNSTFNLSKNGYLMSIDVWNAAVISFVVLAFLETPVCYWLETTLHNVDKNHLKISNFSSKNKMKSDFSYSDTLDRMSRIVFPLAYCIYNFIYWSIYTGEG